MPPTSFGNKNAQTQINCVCVFFLLSLFCVLYLFPSVPDYGHIKYEAQGGMTGNDFNSNLPKQNHGKGYQMPHGNVDIFRMESIESFFVSF